MARAILGAKARTRRPEPASYNGVASRVGTARPSRSGSSDSPRLTPLNGNQIKEEIARSS